MLVVATVWPLVVATVWPLVVATVWPLVVASCGVLGLAIGSFLNVVVHRLPAGMSLARPPSHCPGCGVELRALDNVPIASWLVLRGRCRHCGMAISVRYPVVELAGGIGFAGIAAAVAAAAVAGGPDAGGATLLVLPSLLVVVATGIAATAIDADGARVPRSLAAVGLVGAASLIAVSIAWSVDGRLVWAALGGLTSALGGLTSALGGLTSALGGLTSAASPSSCSNPGKHLRSNLTSNLARILVLGAVGWSAGWLWPWGGFAVAGWLALVAGGGYAHLRRQAVVVLASGVSLVILVLAAAFGRPLP